MILLYRVFSYLIYPFLVIVIYYRKKINKEHSQRYKEKIFVSHFNVKKRRQDFKLIWFHAASVGEFKSILPIVQKLNETYNKIDILITTTTLSSCNLASFELKKFKNVEHRFFPLDVNFLIEKFLSSWKPDRIFLVDSEIWPNLILNAKKKEIPIALINARLTKKSYNRWLKFSKTAKKLFNIFELCLSSNYETRDFLKNLNARNIFFNGNIKLIDKIDINQIENKNKNILQANRFWVAASTHKEEEIFCIKVHLELKKIYDNVITIIAPRHIDRSMQIKTLAENFNLNVQLLNRDDSILQNSEIIVINSFGILLEYFKYSKSVFIGKSMIKRLENDSGQNPIDAAKLNCKIYHGPYVNNFKDIYSILKKNNISKQIQNFEELSENLKIDLKSQTKIYKQTDNIIEHLGQKTLSDTMKNVKNFIINDSKKTKILGR